MAVRTRSMDDASLLKRTFAPQHSNLPFGGSYRELNYGFRLITYSWTRKVPGLCATKKQATASQPRLVDLILFVAWRLVSRDG
jgi:hypothetical protein